MIEAVLYEKSENLSVRCRLCAHRCLINEGKRGICGVRKNVAGTLFSLNYDRVAAVHLDPIEKKPLYHFFPGSLSYSLAAMGCNFKCEFCQNFTLSQVKRESHILGEPISPEVLVAGAISNHVRSISYTYSEPTVFFELMMQTAKLAKARGIQNVMVTNGYMTPEALQMMAPVLDAANVDLKAYSEAFYKKYCAAKMAPVLETIQGMHLRGIWVEITTLLIPGLNTDMEQLKRLISFILAIDPSIPWHVSRFFPQYQMLDVPITPADVILKVSELAHSMGLRFVYGGNLADDAFSDTRCPSCREISIKRNGYLVEVKQIANGHCTNCGHLLPGRW